MRRLMALVVVLGVCISVGLFFVIQSPMTTKAQGKRTLMAGVGTPTLDGAESQGEWPSDSIVTGRGVTIKAMVDGNHLYVLAKWGDSTNSTAKDQWTFDGTKWNEAGNEDRIAFVWDMKNAAGDSLNGEEGASCESMCHLQQGMMRTSFGRVDVWHWKAHRFNPMGFSDDKYWDSCETCSDGGRHGDSGNESGARNRNFTRTRPEFMAAADPGANVDFLADDQATLDAFDPFGILPGTVDLKVPFDTGAQFAPGSVIPGRILSIPTGNRASVRSAGKWANRAWTVEFMRPLAGELDSEGRPEDFEVVLGGSTEFTVERFLDYTDTRFHAAGADTNIYTLQFPEINFLYFAQFADGDGLFSQITLLNPSDTEASAKITLRDDNGNPLTVDLNGNEVVGELDVTIPAHGLRRFQTDGLGETVIGSVVVDSDEALSGVVLFGGATGLAGVGASPAIGTDGFAAPMEVDTAKKINTGIALMNLGVSKLTAMLQLKDEDDSLLATGEVNLEGMGHRAFFVTEIAWDNEVDFSSFSGVLNVTSIGTISATVIQTRPDQFATMPVAPN